MEMRKRTPWYVMLAVFIMVGLILAPESTVRAGQTDLIGPLGSGSFGKRVYVLPNGNIVVTDPFFDAGATVDVGAVYLYDGATGALISTLTGSTADDQVGFNGVTVLSNGNYVVSSHDWDNGGVEDAGAVTWGDSTTGIDGVVSPANSLVGSSVDDWVGQGGIEALDNGNYVVCSGRWNNGGVLEAGAATWADGTTGITGTISSSNSLVGSSTFDHVGLGDVVELSNGNYVLITSQWENSGQDYAGAVTWADGTTGITGTISASNSLVGSTAHDQVGSGGVVALSNGNYVVSSRNWDDGGTTDAGAVTWGDGTTGTSGVVSSVNSLVGSSNDQVGVVTALSNGNYVVHTRYWDNGGTSGVGAVTWGDGTTGIVGTISSSNSLIGSTAYDQVGSGGVFALSNGNYVVHSPWWDNGGTTNAGAVTWMNGTVAASGVVSSASSLVGVTSNDFEDGDILPLSNGHYVVISPYWDNGGVVDAGAVTWADGTTSTDGVVSSANSLVGSTTDDRVGYSDVSPLVRSVTALSNGNYVVGSYHWDNGSVVDAGAATWGNGTTGITGTILSSNSLVGSSANDRVGRYGVRALSNGNYVARSYLWDDGGVVDAGAATWGDGTTGIAGTISSSNSLVGSTADDQVGFSVVALSNGNYVVRSHLWDNGGVMNAGAVTWGNGETGISGVVSSANSLVGSTADDRVGSDGVVEISGDSYIVSSPVWDNGGAVNAGAVTMILGTGSRSGPVTDTNSALGTATGSGSNLVFGYDDTNDQLVVGWPENNTVTFFRLYQVYLPLVLSGG